MSFSAENVFRKPNGYWWGVSLNKKDREFSLHTRDEKLARARYAGFYAHFEAWKRDDPYGDAGMDNPPEPMPQTTTDTAVAALHRRVAKLEEALTEIERYASDDHVKRRARAALS